MYWTIWRYFRAAFLGVLLAVTLSTFFGPYDLSMKTIETEFFEVFGRAEKWLLERIEMWMEYNE